MGKKRNYNGVSGITKGFVKKMEEDIEFLRMIAESKEAVRKRNEELSKK